MLAAPEAGQLELGLMLTMANGELFEQITKIIEGEESLPDKVTNNIIFASIVHLNRAVTKLSDRVEALEDRKPDCDACKNNITRSVMAELRFDFAQRIEVLEKDRDKIKEADKREYVSWPWLLEKIGVPIILIFLTAILTLIITHGISP